MLYNSGRTPPPPRETPPLPFSSWQVDRTHVTDTQNICWDTILAVGGIFPYSGGFWVCNQEVPDLMVTDTLNRRPKRCVCGKISPQYILQICPKIVSGPSDSGTLSQPKPGTSVDLPTAVHICIKSTPGEMFMRMSPLRGKGMAESFSRQKSRHAPQKEGGLKILCDLPPVWPRLVRPTNLMSRMDGKKTHTHTHPPANNTT